MRHWRSNTRVSLRCRVCHAKPDRGTNTLRYTSKQAHKFCKRSLSPYLRQTSFASFAYFKNATKLKLMLKFEIEVPNLLPVLNKRRISNTWLLTRFQSNRKKSKRTQSRCCFEWCNRRVWTVRTHNTQLTHKTLAHFLVGSCRISQLNSRYGAYRSIAIQ